MNHRTIAEEIFLAGVESVKPEKLINKWLSLKDNFLLIGHMSFCLDQVENIFIVGAGKASAMMGFELEKILGERITDGQIVVKYGHSLKLKYIKVSEAGHPIPDSKGIEATRKILKIATESTVNDLVICLLSGGGSALLADYPEGSSLKEMIKVNKLLVNSGACISEINAVRKHLSYVKGGQLARRVSPATLISLIISDVPGDNLDVIASGPTSPDPTTFNHALEVLGKFTLSESVPKAVLSYLEEGEAGIRPETPKPMDAVFEKTHNILIGTNRLALEAARQKALEYNINPIIIDDQLQGDVGSVADYIVETSLRFKEDKNEIKPVCLLFGGETTVTMTGKGLGGRNQHLALLCAGLLQNHEGITVLSAGTDGTDGPTNAAGAVVDSDTLSVAQARHINHEKFLKKFDSYHFFKKVGGHIFTGPTMTNVMDIIVVLIE